MKARYLAMLATVVILTASSSATAKQMTPKDINYLAHLWDSNRSYFERFISGVATFSGTGVVDANGGQVNPELDVDMGTFGTVACISTNGKQSGLPMPGLKPSDRIFVTGSIGGAITAARVGEINEITALPATDPRYVPPLKVKDRLSLLAGTCLVEKVN